MSEAEAQPEAQAQAQADKDVDELEDFEDSDDENTTEFRVRDPLNPPTANLFSTQALHSMSFCIQLRPAAPNILVSQPSFTKV
jgi:hypothetical protein